MTLNIATHKSILVKVLKDIYTDPTLGPLLGFKGGTAAYLFYNLGRFSVDLDFDLFDADKTEYVFEKIKEILQRYGTVKEAEIKRFNIICILAYEGKLPGAQNVKIDINRRAFGSTYEVKSYLGISLQVMVRDDMFAHKLCAMAERIGDANRDIFDVWYFLEKGWDFNKKIVEARSGMGYKDFLQHCIILLEGLESKSLLSGLGELLDAKQKAWVKAKLKSETIFHLKNYLSVLQ